MLKIPWVRRSRVLGRDVRTTLLVVRTMLHEALELSLEREKDGRER